MLHRCSYQIYSSSACEPYDGEIEEFAGCFPSAAFRGPVMTLDPWSSGQEVAALFETAASPLAG